MLHTLRAAGNSYYIQKYNLEATMSSSDTASYNSEDELYDDYIKQFSGNGTQIDCNICKKLVMNNTYNIIQHVEGTPHQNALETFLEDNNIEDAVGKVYYCNYCDAYTGNFWAHVTRNIDHINWTRIFGGVNKHDIKYYVYDNPDHYLADQYLNLYRNMLVDNAIRDDDGSFFCKPCNLELTPTSEISHMFGERHKEGLSAFQDRYKL